MFAKLIFRLLRRALTQKPQSSPRPSQKAPSAAAVTEKKKALSATEVRARLSELPEGSVIYVQDGDTLIVRRGWSETTIRLDSIDCPEDGQPWGDTARFGLVKLVGGCTVRIEEHGVDPYGRTLATIYVQNVTRDDWLNVNERMITLGHAWAMRRYYDHLPPDRQKRLNDLEAWARSKKVGLWGTENPVPPWAWRKQQNGLATASK